ncbi:MAG: exodeoxyribonuclease VII large subunit [Candidatus Koribacter versatilis]|uniref:Exodeoxyribonuclease 7 large subunit n=1 Tax=Candidatus Korobacter versatilis TaxID=658062 RepID=A0A932ERQ8_9BACT|nr:exodeoxyribonuclease VII large subunit [Candidatus Koribacter versatilis]
MSGQLDFTFQAMAAQRRVWAVRELMSAVRTALEREYTDVWVEGEVSNFRPAESGHLYFTLKDGDAQLRLVMFRTQARLLRFKPENGMQIVARGRVTVYEARGEMQLAAEYLEPKGAGALQVAFEQLKAKLAAEGLFDAARKKLLPALPRRIGVITSRSGAALQDILNILRRRHESVPILIYPAQVQGAEAAREVSAGLKWFNRTSAAEDVRVDVIIIARGGGSVEDLAAFNHEGLARAIVASDVPVISAIGHETDFTIADFVADLRAPTPSAAAELVIESRHRMEEQVGSLAQRLARAARYRLLMGRQTLTELAQHGAFARIRAMLAQRQQRVDELTFELASQYRELVDGYRRRVDVAATRIRHYDVRLVLAGMRRELEAKQRTLGETGRRLVMERRSALERASAKLDELSPLKVLDRGYALIFDAAGNVVKDAAQVATGDEVRARLARGEIAAVVKKPRR